jgi:hypothetical protein
MTRSTILGDENDDEVAGKSVESSSDATKACYEASRLQGLFGLMRCEKREVRPLAMSYMRHGSIG